MSIQEALSNYQNSLYYNEEWHKLAMDGDVDSIVNIGADFARSEMMEHAVACWQYVIDTGHGIDEAYSNLGVSYYYGNGVKQNYKKAVQYYQKAAAKGHPWGMYNLAVACENGKGTPKDMEKALFFYRKAANQNIRMAIDALRRLGKDDVITYNETDSTTEGFIGDVYERICSKISEFEEEWARCNNNKNINVQVIPLIFDSATRRRVDFEDVISLIDKAISMKPSAALYYTKGNMYRYNGDEDTAIEYYKKSIELDSNDYQALCNIGVMFYNKEMDLLALECFSKSAEIHPSSLAYNNLGNVYKVLGETHKSDEYYQMAMSFNDFDDGYVF